MCSNLWVKKIAIAVIATAVRELIVRVVPAVSAC